jgi:hypothetical protein
MGARKCAQALALPQQGGTRSLVRLARQEEGEGTVSVYPCQLKPLVTLSNHARIPAGPVERAATQARQH